MRYIITADDFGMSPSTDRTIMQGIEEGVISSTNIMMNMPCLDDCAALLRDKRIYVGIHWNLTTGKPLSAPEKVPSLVDGNGDLFAFPVFKEKAYQGEIRKEHVALELKAQMDAYLARFGKPDYWNTHNHTQMVTPLFDTFLEVAAGYDVLAMRNNYKLYNGFNLKFAVKNRVIGSMYRKAKEKRMHMPDGLVSFDAKNPRFSVKSYELKGDGVAEIMIHVAAVCDSAFFGKMTEERIRQKEFYFSDAFKAFAKDKIVYKQIR